MIPQLVILMTAKMLHRQKKDREAHSAKKLEAQAAGSTLNGEDAEEDVPVVEAEPPSVLSLASELGRHSVADMDRSEELREADAADATASAPKPADNPMTAVADSNR